jgi:protein SCO1
MQGRLGTGILAVALLSGATALLLPRAAFAGGAWGAGYFPNVPLTTQDGKVVRFYDDLLKGKAVAVNLMYTHCSGNCPLETARMAQVQKLLGDRVGKEIFFYSITVEPDRDTPEVLKAYAARYHVKPGWLFLTGKKDDIKLISQKLGLSSLTDGSDKDGHQPSLMIGNEATGQWMRNSAVDNPQFLATTMINFLEGYKANKQLKSYADMDLKEVGKGEYLYKTRCSACHTIGAGDATGPDLKGVTARRDRAWVKRYMIEPDKMLAQGDKIAVELFGKYKNVRMPNLDLRNDDVAALVTYIEGKSQAPKGHAASASLH